jgi:hypothetical protein
MLKTGNNVQPNDLNGLYVSRLSATLAEVPFLRVRSSVGEPSAAIGQLELILDVDVAGSPWKLLCAFKQHTQLRHVRSGIFQLHHSLKLVSGTHRYAVLVGPYISPEAATLLRQQNIGFADLAGNCFLSFGSVHIDRSGAHNPFTLARKQRSLFAPKSTQVLFSLLQHPGRSWRTQELATEAGVSLGQISNVKQALLDREWAATDPSGLRIIKPNALLDAWRSAYERRGVERHRYYTPLLGDALDSATRQGLAAAYARAAGRRDYNNSSFFEGAIPMSIGTGTDALLASFSAARWMAPFARTSTTYFYATAAGDSVLRDKLQLVPVDRGENVVIDIPQHDTVFRARVESAPGIWATNPIQTYLDLCTSGERGVEAAEHLRTIKISPAWKPLS